MDTTTLRKTDSEPGNLPGLASLQPVEEIPKTDPFQRYFRTRDSWNWFKQQHGPELVKAGAIVTIANRDYFVSRVLERVILKIGRRAAAARCK